MAEYRVSTSAIRRSRTLDEALRFAVAASWPLDRRCAVSINVARAHGRVRRRRPGPAAPMAAAWRRLDKQPNAQVALAWKMLTQAAKLPEAEGDRVREDARLLMAKAVGSRDPEAILDAAIMSHLRKGVAQGDDGHGGVVARGLRARPRLQSFRRTHAAGLQFRAELPALRVRGRHAPPRDRGFRRAGGESARVQPSSSTRGTCGCWAFSAAPGFVFSKSPISGTSSSLRPASTPRRAFPPGHVDGANAFELVLPRALRGS